VEQITFTVFFFVVDSNLLPLDHEVNDLPLWYYCYPKKSQKITTVTYTHKKYAVIQVCTLHVSIFAAPVVDYFSIVVSYSCKLFIRLNREQKVFLSFFLLVRANAIKLFLVSSSGLKD
jgi:hypothetical protein